MGHQASALSTVLIPLPTVCFPVRYLLQGIPNRFFWFHWMDYFLLISSGLNSTFALDGIKVLLCLFDFSTLLLLDTCFNQIDCWVSVFLMLFSISLPTSVACLYVLCVVYRVDIFLISCYGSRLLRLLITFFWLLPYAEAGCIATHSPISANVRKLSFIAVFVYSPPGFCPKGGSVLVNVLHFVAFASSS